MRESYRENGKVRKRRLRNLSDWPAAHVEGLRDVLKGGTVIAPGRDAFTVSRFPTVMPRSPSARRKKSALMASSDLMGTAAATSSWP